MPLVPHEVVLSVLVVPLPATVFLELSMVTLLEVEVMAVVTEPTLDELEVVANPADDIAAFVDEMADDIVA